MRLSRVKLKHINGSDLDLARYERIVAELPITISGMDETEVGVEHDRGLIKIRTIKGTAIYRDLNKISAKYGVEYRADKEHPYSTHVKIYPRRANKNLATLMLFPNSRAKQS